MRLRYFVIRRLLLLIPTLLGLTIITFLIMYSLETTHIQLLLSGYVPANARNRQQLIQEAYYSLGFNLSAPQQYFLYMSRLFTGSWGYLPQLFPVYGSDTVMTAIAYTFPKTIQLAFFATLLSILISIPVGTYIGSRPNSLSDGAGRVFSLVGYAMPAFFLGIIMLLVFANGGIIFPNGGGFPVAGTMPTLTKLPKWISTGLTSPTHIPMLDALIHGDFSFFASSFVYIVLPVLTITYGILAGLLRFIRSGMVDNLNQEYVKTARAKGVPENLVLKHHVRRNAMIPAVTVMGLLFAGLLGGVVVVEEIFGYYGIGWLAVNSVLGSSISVYGILATTFLFGIILVSANLVVDLVYAFLDPRIRY